MFDLLAPEWDTKWGVWRLPCCRTLVLWNITKTAAAPTSRLLRHSECGIKSWNLPHPVFWVVGWYFHLLWIHSLKTLCSALNPLTDQALHYPYSVRVLSEVIQLMLFPLQKTVQRLALIMPRLSARVLYGPTCCCFPPLLSGHVAKSWKWTEPCLFRGSFCQSLSARKFTS